jgi:hypothetical protein
MTTRKNALTTAILLAGCAICLERSAIADHKAPAKVDYTQPVGSWSCEYSDADHPDTVYLTLQGEHATFQRSETDHDQNATYRDGVLTVTWPGWPYKHISWTLSGPIEIKDGVANVVLKGTEDVHYKDGVTTHHSIWASCRRADRSSKPAPRCSSLGDSCAKYGCCDENREGAQGPVCDLRGTWSQTQYHCIQCLKPGAYVGDQRANGYFECCSWQVEQLGNGWYCK